MDKSGVIVGTALGAIVVLVVFAFVLNPPPTMSPKELVVSNGHGPSTVGETTLLSKGKGLSLVEIFENTESGVVRVNVQRNDDAEGRGGVGSGFVFDLRGHIITNAHVVKDSKKIVVTFVDGSDIRAELLGVDQFTDLAVLKVENAAHLLTPLRMGDSSNLKVGEPIAAIGNPFGLSGSMTSGIVSQLGRLLPISGSGFSIPDVIQTDAAINPGNSGGPLLNMRGEVIGINTAIQSADGDFSGIGFSVPSNTAAKIIPTLISTGEYAHPWLGISGRDIDPDLAKVIGVPNAKGFMVVTVVEDSPASKAGLHGAEDTKEIEGVSYPIGGDIILSVDGIEVRKIDDILIHLQRAKAVGDELILEILRDGRTSTFVLVLEERPNS